MKLKELIGQRNVLANLWYDHPEVEPMLNLYNDAVHKAEMVNAQDVELGMKVMANVNVAGSGAVFDLSKYLNEEPIYEVKFTNNATYIAKCKIK